MPGGTISFHGEIIDDSKVKKADLARIEMHYEDKYPYHVYNTKGRFCGAVGSKADADTLIQRLDWSILTQEP